MSTFYPGGGSFPWQPNGLPAPYTQPNVIPWQPVPPVTYTQTLRTPLKCKCGKQCSYKRLATETKPTKNEGIVIVVKEREALYCDECGVIAWSS